MEERCESVFAHYVSKEYQCCSPETRDDLLRAFVQGTEAAKHHRGIDLCPYSATTQPDEFMAWIEGFKCCSTSDVTAPVGTFAHPTSDL
jgi:ribosome modulation factor